MIIISIIIYSVIITPFWFSYVGSTNVGFPYIGETQIGSGLIDVSNHVHILVSPTICGRNITQRGVKCHGFEEKIVAQALFS